MQVLDPTLLLVNPLLSAILELSWEILELKKKNWFCIWSEPVLCYGDYMKKVEEDNQDRIYLDTQFSELVSVPKLFLKLYRQDMAPRS